jgi:hypothetical protein
MSKLPCYEYDEMLDLVLDAYEGSVDMDSAEVLMRRGMAPAPKHVSSNGYHFARDVRLKVSLLGMMSLEQVLSYAEQIKCKVLNIRGMPGKVFDNPDVYARVIEQLGKTAGKLTYLEIPGTHHLHLTTPERVCKPIGDFLLD